MKNIIKILCFLELYNMSEKKKNRDPDYGEEISEFGVGA